MGQIIYSNNDVEITAEVSGEYDTKINVNGENLIWISAPEIGEFKKELSAVLDKYRIQFNSKKLEPNAVQVSVINYEIWNFRFYRRVPQ